MLEITTFSLVGGEPAVAGFLAADARFQTEVAYQQPGLVRRTTARGEGGRWGVVSRWASAADADRAAVALVTHPATVALRGFVDASSIRTERFVPLA